MTANPDEATVGRAPHHLIERPRAPCDPAMTPVALVRDQNLCDKSTIFVPPKFSLSGRLFLQPASPKGHPVVARTSTHSRPGAQGAFANPDLCDRLDAKSQAHDWICARRARWWEILRYQPGVRPALLVAAVNLAGAVGIAAWAGVKDLNAGQSFVPVAIVLALTLTQAIANMYKALTDAKSPAWAGWVAGVVLALLLIGLLIPLGAFSHHAGPSVPGHNGTPESTRSSPSVPTSTSRP
jgi:hypothetical protein